MHHIRVCRAHLEVHVGVEDPGGKAHSGRRERVGVGHLNLQPKRAALKGRVGRSLLMMLIACRSASRLYLDPRRPAVYVGFGWQQLDLGAGTVVCCLELLGCEVFGAMPALSDAHVP